MGNNKVVEGCERCSTPALVSDAGLCKPCEASLTGVRREESVTVSAKFEVVRSSEKDAHTTRRGYIVRGRSVSLIAYDGSRDAYEFDVLS